MQNKIKKYNLTKSNILFICIILFPMVSHLAVFWLGATVKGLAMSFIDDKTGAIGFSNYISVFTGFVDADGVLLESIRNTLIFFASSLLNIPISIFAAYMIYKKMFGSKVVRIMLVLPGIISGMMMCIMYQQFLTTDGPLLTLLIDKWGWDIATPLIMEHPIAMMIVFGIWIGLGGNLIIWLGAMGKIDSGLLEYAKLDGIKTFQEFYHIILPAIWPTVVTMVSIQCMGIWGSSGDVLLFTEGKYGTFTLSYYMYEVIYKGVTSQYNIAMALGLVMSLASVPIIVLFRKVLNRKDVVED